MTDLEQRIFRIVTSTRVQADIPGAIVAEIERTHDIVERPRNTCSNEDCDHGKVWTHSIRTKAGEIKEFYKQCPVCKGTGDLEPIRHDAAASDTPETTAER